ncbi:hypothetical protein NSK_006297 [Nannochloropsis salina CCMP1776]|uniref:Uncharacterized protein n=1 Tax=Nannochloropsis salina CCMP1776 TaxID=1027361 RepID=A0A4D9CU38_9STRA|nr:hypothetical protein NSK_006297 [Nannochloropsis salina CCMP1776]|eukprot:TFJ82386.1 hypothetical protein NSK_006297 [Nannochloropsis salina CCMP1776]
MGLSEYKVMTSSSKCTVYSSQHVIIDKMHALRVAAPYPKEADVGHDSNTNARNEVIKEDEEQGNQSGQDERMQHCGNPREEQGKKALGGQMGKNSSPGALRRQATLPPDGFLTRVMVEEDIEEVATLCKEAFDAQNKLTNLKPEFPNGPPVAFYRQAHANPRIVTVVALSREEGGREGGQCGLLMAASYPSV